MAEPTDRVEATMALASAICYVGRNLVSGLYLLAGEQTTLVR
jgi:hypothetical protein